MQEKLHKLHHIHMPSIVVRCGGSGPRLRQKPNNLHSPLQNTAETTKSGHSNENNTKVAGHEQRHRLSSSRRCALVLVEAGTAYSIKINTSGQQATLNGIVKCSNISFVSSNISGEESEMFQASYITFHFGRLSGGTQRSEHRTGFRRKFRTS